MTRLVFYNLTIRTLQESCRGERQTQKGRDRGVKKTVDIMMEDTISIVLADNYGDGPTSTPAIILTVLTVGFRINNGFGYQIRRWKRQKFQRISGVCRGSTLKQWSRELVTVTRVFASLEGTSAKASLLLLPLLVPLLLFLKRLNRVIAVQGGAHLGIRLALLILHAICGHFGPSSLW